MSLPPRVVACAACLLLAFGAAAQGQSSHSTRSSKDLSVDCPPTAAGGKHASARTPLTTRNEASTLHKDMAQCTSKRNRNARAECAREVWEARAAATGSEPSNQRMAMADCR